MASWAEPRWGCSSSQPRDHARRLGAHHFFLGFDRGPLPLGRLPFEAPPLDAPPLDAPPQGLCVHLPAICSESFWHSALPPDGHSSWRRSASARHSSSCCLRRALQSLSATTASLARAMRTNATARFTVNGVRMSCSTLL